MFLQGKYYLYRHNSMHQMLSTVPTDKCNKSCLGSNIQQDRDMMTTLLLSSVCMASTKRGALLLYLADSSLCCMHTSSHQESNTSPEGIFRKEKAYSYYHVLTGEVIRYSVVEKIDRLHTWCIRPLQNLNPISEK